MPELIDLEVARENMLSRVEGKRVVRVDFPVEKILRNASVIDVKDSIEGHVLKSISRMGKLLIFEFDGNTKLVFHLMLHGDFCWKTKSADKVKGVVFEMEFDSGDTILGKDWSAWMKVELDDKSKKFTSDLLNGSYGVDALSSEFTADELEGILSRRSRAGIKAVLMDQKEIAGIGNAYTDESLWDAKIHPSTKSGSIVESGEVSGLWNSIKSVLGNALERVRELSQGAISEQDRDFMKVYRKSGQKCPRCGYMISQHKVAGRDTFVCEKCQNPP